ncbi:MAG: hypothetical protein IPG96_02455 [Proteobacteria bacterium]|nr:hypothetical protein [Pseudomonadota bacterium]
MRRSATTPDLASQPPGRWLALALVAGLVLTGCEPGPAEPADPNATPAPDASVPATPTPYPPDVNICRTDTVDSCGQCAYRCPGPDDATTMRACEGGRCELVCRGTSYDIDGELSNGCETQDDLAERQLAAIDDCDSSGGSVNGRILADTRRHTEAPTTRADGAPDTYRIPDRGRRLLHRPADHRAGGQRPTRRRARAAGALRLRRSRAGLPGRQHHRRQRPIEDRDNRHADLRPCSGSDSGELIPPGQEARRPRARGHHLLRYRAEGWPPGPTSPSSASPTG